MSLKQITQKIKHIRVGEYIEEIYLILVVIMAVLIAFGLGIIYSMPEKSEIVVVDGLNIDFSKAEVGEEERVFVASKNGTKYYPINCRSSSRIKYENRVYFRSKEDAENRGYEATKSC